jgi:hypothetical protein
MIREIKGLAYLPAESSREEAVYAAAVGMVAWQTTKTSARCERFHQPVNIDCR